MTPTDHTPEKPELTDRQQEILDFIRLHISEHGYAPTIREIGAAFGIRSTNGVHDHLQSLERKGYLERGSLKSRALRVLSGEEASPERPSRRRAQSSRAPAARGLSPTHLAIPMP